MSRYTLSLLAPPLAVCRYGCAGCCAAPIGVFWVTGIVSMVYGFLGGPLHHPGTSWPTVALGLALWAIASVWAMVTLRNVEETAGSARSGFCRAIDPAEEEHPLDQVHKAR